MSFAAPTNVRSASRNYYSKVSKTLIMLLHYIVVLSVLLDYWSELCHDVYRAINNKNPPLRIFSEAQNPNFSRVLIIPNFCRQNFPAFLLFFKIAPNLGSPEAVFWTKFPFPPWYTPKTPLKNFRLRRAFIIFKISKTEFFLPSYYSQNSPRKFPRVFIIPNRRGGLLLSPR